MNEISSRSPSPSCTVSVCSVLSVGSEDGDDNSSDHHRLVEAENETESNHEPTHQPARNQEASATAGVSAQPNPLATNLVFLEGLILVEEQRYKELAFVRGYSASDKCPIYVITQRLLFNHPPYGLTSRINITLKGCEYVINVLAFHLESGTIASVEDLDDLCRRFSSRSLQKFCPGIDWNVYEQKYHKIIRYHLKSVRYSTFPYQRVDSARCLLWFKVARNATLAEKSASEVMCSACKRLKANLDWQLKRTRAESPTRKIKRQSASSTARLRYMSPESQRKRKKNMVSQRNKGKKSKRKIEVPVNSGGSGSVDSADT